MAEYLRRSANKANRKNLTLSDRWDGPDHGLIWCWERGREKQVEEPELAARAREGELVPLVWKRGTPRDAATRENPESFGSLYYLAMWQGLRGEGLDVLVDGRTTIVCTKTQKIFIFVWVAGLNGVDGEKLGES